MSNIDYITFGVILDDIVSFQGQTHMNVLGGGGPQTAFGMRLWTKSVGLVAGVNEDDFGHVHSWLNDAGIDSHGLRATHIQTPRAWQLIEEDGRRTQVWRVSQDTITVQLSRSMKFLPGIYRHAMGYHFGIHPDDPDLDFIAHLRELGGTISVEPFKSAEERPSEKELRALLINVDIFSANQLEARSLVQADTIKENALRFVEAGAQTVVIRCGSQGSYILDKRSNLWVHIPAVPVHVVDPVGAGNAYCGGFLVGWSQTGDVGTAAAYGAVSASFLLEQVGLPKFLPNLISEAKSRMQDIQRLVEILPLD